eukprot:TRINITY_DN10963_c0_g1_i1.p1 TRINITY_DN10963_c0_g1~~TRINITY_DN10963_c0_g1_i1.p1  ORF type:complete len:584 (-),score=73.72 TRINITY_DN10963_c0_g1_i1:24-1775(-)
MIPLFKRVHRKSKRYGVRRLRIKNYSRRIEKPVITSNYGFELIHSSLYNKGTSFPHGERDRLGIRGLVPPACISIEQQTERVLRRYATLKDPLQKYLYLSGLQDRNETLFYHLLTSDMESYAPIIYTPTVGQACKEFSYQYRQARGMYFTPNDRGEMSSMVYNWPENEVDVIVVTDGSRILGLGDLGCQGMGISIGKLSLYVAAGGIHPKRTLPICLDVGTNNEKLLNDPLYIGIRERRLSGEEYYSFVEEFMNAIANRWPDVLIQFEDFSNENALPLLDKYRFKHLCFNDDIQGTGAVALAGLIGAMRVKGGTIKDLARQRIVVVGAGSAGLGVANSLAWTMIQEIGLSTQEAFSKFWLLDKDGLLGAGRMVHQGQLRYVRADMENNLPLEEVVKKVKPTVILGLSGVGGLFTESVIKEMYKHEKRPVIFPLSNPTPNSECSAEQAYTWTEGNAIFASGSPFDPVTINGKVCRPSQGNNMFIFPGVGQGATAVKARRISYRMLNKAGITLADTILPSELEAGYVYPHINRIRGVSLKVAASVARTAFMEGLARVEKNDYIEAFIEDKMFIPSYAPIISTHRR